MTLKLGAHQESIVRALVSATVGPQPKCLACRIANLRGDIGHDGSVVAMTCMILTVTAMQQGRGIPAWCAFHHRMIDVVGESISAESKEIDISNSLDAQSPIAPDATDADGLIGWFRDQ